MKVVSFFAGCGGLDLGFEQAGFQVVWANEHEKNVRATYLRNHPNTEFVLADINKLSPNDVPDCDGFIGGPPCQSWSVAGKQRGLKDERGKLFLTYIEMIKAKKPKFFLIENVKGMLDEKFKDVFQDFLVRLDKIGYTVKWSLLDAVKYGIPQNRERVFLIGFLKELQINYEFPLPTTPEPITLERALGDITEPPTVCLTKSSNETSTLRPNHDVLSTTFGPFYYRGNRHRGWQQPSFTIHATAENIPLHPSSPKMMYYGHENWNFQKDQMERYRRLSVRECARIQTFPDKFIFEAPNIEAAYKMIGNAVPPRLARILAKSISEAIEHVPASVDIPSVSNNSNVCTLVGYYKNESQYDLIKRNKLYYVRSDGRKGSMFKENCEVTPSYVLLHHLDKSVLLELDKEEPVLASGSFLETLGFDSQGETYLCFRLTTGLCLSPKDLGAKTEVLKYNKANYAPYFTRLGEILDL